MEKFGLDSPPQQKLNALEQEIAKEKASALGITGKKLAQLLTDYRQNLRQSGAATCQEALISKIADNLSELLIQRELAGLPHENLEWVLKTYDVPEEVLERLGIRGTE